MATKTKAKRYEDEMKPCLDAGKAAALAGLAWEACPHKLDLHRRNAWLIGHKNGLNELERPKRLAAELLRNAAPDLLEACKKALEHVRELREAWRTGALSECDGRGGQRSNLNVDVEVALAKAIAKATPAPAVNETP